MFEEPPLLPSPAPSVLPTAEGSESKTGIGKKEVASVVEAGMLAGSSSVGEGFESFSGESCESLIASVVDAAGGDC